MDLSLWANWILLIDVGEKLTESEYDQSIKEVKVEELIKFLIESFKSKEMNCISW